eukprot:TRINITY_DN21666_c0_g1_i1.p1 TRINITY_DN21666_c0_g1~~TRINITY_DN21666_c0_g1_i1.p1  ORF type:complete len:459 (+),score=148.33 TRINITY_DN21666_c0_g1_i1:48-1424(+)
MKLLFVLSLIVFAAFAQISYSELSNDAKIANVFGASKDNVNLVDSLEWFGVQQCSKYFFFANDARSSILRCSSNSAEECVTYKTFSSYVSGLIVFGNNVYVATSDSTASTLLSEQKVYKGTCDQDITVTAPTLRRSLLSEGAAVFNEIAVSADVTTEVGKMAFEEPRYWFDIENDALTLEVMDDRSTVKEYLIFTTKTHGIDALTASDITFKTSLNHNDALWFDDHTADVEYVKGVSYAVVKSSEAVDVTGQTYREFGVQKTFNLVDANDAQISKNAAYSIDYEKKKVYTFYAESTNAGFGEHTLCVHTIDPTASTGTNAASTCKDQTSILKMDVTCQVGNGVLICREIMDDCTSSSCYQKMLYIYDIKDDATLTLRSKGNKSSNVAAFKETFDSAGSYRYANGFFDDALIAIDDDTLISESMFINNSVGLINLSDSAITTMLSMVVGIIAVVAVFLF